MLREFIDGRLIRLDRAAQGVIIAAFAGARRFLTRSRKGSATGF
jgi:hypothetical protein